jgi:hypothetical protein
MSCEGIVKAIGNCVCVARVRLYSFLLQGLVICLGKAL